MFSNWFYSKIITVRQHHTEKSIGVVRVRDCLQTFIGDWKKLKALDAESQTVAVFMHGAQVRCIWNTLNEVEKKHFDDTTTVVDNASTSSSAEIKTANVSVLKIGRLISFGIVQPVCNCSIVISMQQQVPMMHLTKHPPILRHLLQQQCFIIEWNHTEDIAGVVQFDGNDFFGEARLLQVCNQYKQNFTTMMQREFGMQVGSLTLTFLTNDNYELQCGQIEIHGQSKSLLLSVGTSAELCKLYDIPSRHLILHQGQDGLHQWLSLDSSPSTVVNELQSDYYNAENENFMLLLYNANRQPNVTIFNDTQILDAMKLLQTKCDDYCKKPSRRRCDGFLIQFYQLPTTIFCIPSLFFLLSQKK